MSVAINLFDEKNSDIIDILLINHDEFEHWLKEQDQHTQNWAQANNFEGNGHLLIPEASGKLKQCLFITKNSQDNYFIAGDLSLSLPNGRYRLNLELFNSDKTNDDIQLQFAINWGLSQYKFDRYKSSDNKNAILCLPTQDLVNRASNFINSIYLTRDLINTPASDMMPEHLTDTCEALSKQYGAKLATLVGEELIKENYPTIHAVGRASVHEPRLLDLRWGKPDAPKVTLVGKGVCFDSGGLDLKPSSAMRLMKKDMGGAAHVLGLAQLIMSEQLPVQLRVLIPAVENAVSSNAFRPGDVITTRQGITVEIDNTDAEGRLVLCDALTEACSENPEVIFDFATLTGACRVALGTELPGYFCNEQSLANDLFKHGQQTMDPIWQLPLHKPYEDMLKSDVAETLNCAASPFGGAITAALYLEKFISDNTPWVHFDVMAWNNRKLPGRPVGGEAFGIRAVFDYLSKKYRTTE